MHGKDYRRCDFDGEYHHPDETILIPEGQPRPKQKRLCLDHAEQYLKHLIALAECKTMPHQRRRVA